MTKKLVAEGIGTFWLTFGGCGSAVLAALFLGGEHNAHNLGIGLFGVSLAFGLTVLTMAYAIGHISGCHLNPAVTLGLVAAKRFSPKLAGPYILAQTVGALVGAFVLFTIASGRAGVPALSDTAGVFATNGYGDFSPAKFNLMSCFVTEVVLTAMFLFIILGATDKLGPPGFAPIPIGLGLTLIHLIGIPVTNLSVNPARSTGPAVIAALNEATTPITQLWLFWAAPILGAVIGAVAYNFVSKPETPVA